MTSHPNTSSMNTNASSFLKVQANVFIQEFTLDVPASLIDSFFSSVQQRRRLQQDDDEDEDEEDQESTNSAAAEAEAAELKRLKALAEIKSMVLLNSDFQDRIMDAMEIIVIPQDEEDEEKEEEEEETTGNVKQKQQQESHHQPEDEEEQEQQEQEQQQQEIEEDNDDAKKGKKETQQQLPLRRLSKKPVTSSQRQRTVRKRPSTRETLLLPNKKPRKMKEGKEEEEEAVNVDDRRRSRRRQVRTIMPVVVPPPVQDDDDDDYKDDDDDDYKDDDDDCKDEYDYEFCSMTSDEDEDEDDEDDDNDSDYVDDELCYQEHDDDDDIIEKQQKEDNKKNNNNKNKNDEKLVCLIVKREIRDGKVKKEKNKKNGTAAEVKDGNNNDNNNNNEERRILTKDEAWNEMYNRLRKFKEEHGHSRVPQRYHADPRLGRWCDHMRLSYRFTCMGKRKRNKTTMKLTEERYDLLNELGFVWTPPKSKYDWDSCYEQLKQYKDKHGHSYISVHSKEHPTLARWCAQVRKRYKSGTLSPEEFRQLDKLGFLWNARASFWDEMFNRLKKFKEEHGHCSVSQSYRRDPKLGRWCATMRAAWRCRCKGGGKKKLSDERFKLMNDLGFVWRR